MSKKRILREWEASDGQATATMLQEARLAAASALIKSAGGPAVLARKLSQTMSVDVNPDRVSKWAKIGVPAAWGPIVETLFPAFPRTRLNPWLYTDYQQHIHNPIIRYLIGISKS